MKLDIIIAQAKHGQIGLKHLIIAHKIRQLVYQQQKQGLYHARMVTKD
jgi:hypothetical protein